MNRKPSNSDNDHVMNTKGQEGEPIRKENRGGARRGAGRKKLHPDEKRLNVTIKLLPGADVELNLMCDRAASSKGSLIEWFALSPAAAECRKKCMAQAAYFSHRQPMEKESAAAGLARAALRREVRAKLSAARPEQ